MTLTRQWTGTAPFEETWFIEALLGPDRGVWLRFRLDATLGEVELWAVVTTSAGVLHAERRSFPLQPRGSIGPAELFACAAGRLDREHTVGELGPIRWDLALEDRGARHQHQPWWLRTLPLGKTYSPAVLDLRIRGEVWVGDQSWQVRSGPGILGHHWGQRSSVRRWAWAHCNAFDREDLVFEGLSATLGPLPPATSLVLLADGHAYRFSSLRHLWRTRTQTTQDRWAFEAREGSRVLSGVVELDRARAATVTYATGGPNRTVAYCTNSRFASIRLVLTDPKRKLDLDVRSRECAFELVGPEPLATPVLD